MKIVVEYAAQLKDAAGTAAEEVEVPSNCTVRDLAVQLAERHGGAFGRLLLDPHGAIQPSVLLFVGGSQVREDSVVPLRDGDSVSFFTPISGG